MADEEARAAARERKRKQRERQRNGIPAPTPRESHRPGGKASRGRPPVPTLPSAPVAEPPEPPDSEPPAIHPAAAARYESIEDYDRQVGAPLDWGQAQQREKTRGELTLNESRKVDLSRARLALDKERGKLVSIADVEAREERADEIYQRHLAAVLDLAATLVPPDLISGARERAAQWLADRQRLIAGEMG